MRKRDKPKTKIIKGHLPCLKCTSSDGMNIHEGGDAFCWVCGTRFSAKEVEQGEVSSGKPASAKGLSLSKQVTVEEIAGYRSSGFRDRDITTAVSEFFGVKVSFDGDGKLASHYYPYGDGYKQRKLPKTFYAIGECHGLFGKDKFTAGGKRVIITTGELDAMSVAEAMLQHYKGTIYPVVTPGSDNNMKALLEDREWLRSFGEVILLFDNDESGKKAEQEAIRIVGIDKVKIGKLTKKDPNEVLIKDGYKTLMQSVFNAEKYIPGDILTKDALWAKLEEFNKIQSIPFPPCLGGVNDKTKGKRYGEITLFISGTGSGKSTLVREDMLHTLETTEDSIGVLAFEEGPAESARKLSGMAINRNPANEELSLEDLKPGFDKVFGQDRVMILDHQGSITDDSIVDKIEYMVLSGCKHIYIDHITLMVSEGVGDLTGNEATDKIMADLLRLVKRYPIWIGLISHLRKVQVGSKSFEEGKLPSMDDIRGSGSIKQISMDIIAFARNMKSENDDVRNTIKMSVLKCRFTGLTGPVRGAKYLFETGRLVPVDSFEEVEEQNE